MHLEFFMNFGLAAIVEKQIKCKKCHYTQHNPKVKIKQCNIFMAEINYFRSLKKFVP